MITGSSKNLSYTSFLIEYKEVAEIEFLITVLTFLIAH